LLVGLKVGNGDDIGEGGLVGTTLGPAEGVVFALVGAEITGADLMTIVDGPAVDQSSSYASGQASLTELPFRYFFASWMQYLLILLAF
jgi:hypothetical protein